MKDECWQCREGWYVFGNNICHNIYRLFVVSKWKHNFTFLSVLLLGNSGSDSYNYMTLILD